MRIKRLLSAASLVALMSANAHAIEITAVAGGGFQGYLADEVCLDDPSVTMDGVLVFDLDMQNTGNNYPQDLNLVITLPAWMEFSRVLTGGDFIATFPSTPLVTVWEDGATGDQRAQVQLDSSGTAPYPSFQISLPITISKCPTSNGVKILAENGIGGGAVENTRTLVNTGNPKHYSSGTVDMLPGCKSALTKVLVADNTQKDIDFGTAYDVFNGLDAMGTVSATTAALGSYQYTIDPTVLIGPLATDILVASDVTDIEVTVNVGDDAGLTTASADPSGSAVLAGNTATFPAGGFTDGVAEVVYVSAVGAGTPIANQNTDIATSVIFNNPASNSNGPVTLVDKDPQAKKTDQLVRNGLIFGRFDWSGGSLGAGSNTVLRGTGFPANTMVNYTIDLVNAVNPSNNQLYFGSKMTNAGGEMHLTSRTDFGISGLDFTRADALVCFELDPATNSSVDLDRLMLRNDVLSAYNDGSNSNYNPPQTDYTPENDYDNGVPNQE